LPVGHVCQPVDETQETIMLLFEGFVEPLGDLLPVKRIAHPQCGSSEGQTFFFTERKCDVIEFLNQPIGRAGSKPGMFAERGRLALLPRNPLPDLLGFRRVGENNQMLVGEFGNLALNPLARVPIRFGGTDKDADTAFFGDR
jgi:hypothetical protein